ncbi:MULTISPECIES: acyl-CoA dehydrogenase family protein [Pseudomonas]|jgi:alkylation response protein AidB-like acyl-CoA dehydrogenase|uniref:Acyl-CoA dehydrogenase n=1 Tax=Pseudomonas putida TaxID=303 RepID=A0A1L7NCS6_PSEPU|nr:MULTISPECIES: acyl-CoA dehydrogenase family protein [Pseudomonas]AGN82122.1 acyl-CoA dehydrogenase [Pseudomonas putida H8234]EKT4449251.1 acyl-CoA dehydrogenase family protein [Pseudomonas putida]EKT4559824.1 acyl-CoA dehydrogenase family protein [Pseudomonas putida]MBH3447244.1 acyl-CoA dehydrogenase family protein [Pseudomonas putida]MBP2083398.1 alkylation response protein AidB-like acyl-CoA dehydrogenase [Pseudomonas sp. PvP089]
MSAIEQFRQATRQWLEANCPPSLRTPTPDGEIVWGGRQVDFPSEDARLWFERMRDKGWFCPQWPSEYGGGGLSAEYNAVLESELRRLKCRPAQINLGIWMLGPVLLEFGSEAQKQALLPPMCRGEVRWCQGFSEPNAGSDLASLKTSAVADGDDFVINGTKIWTSYGDKSDWMYALVRTDPKAPKHQGISLIVLDMKSPGVSVSPIDLISGKSAFCQVFFDNVRVPQSQLIGPLNGGWNLGKSLLQHERKAMSKFGEFSLPTHFHLLPLIERYLPDSQAPDDQALRARAQACAMNEQAYNLTVQRMGEEARAGLDISAIMAIMKLVHTEQERDKFEILLDALGYRALGVEGEPFSGQELAITRGWLNSYALTISGGSSEVQLNVIAKRVLNLPSA